MASDDELIDALLDKTEKLEDLTDGMVGFFNNTDGNQDFEKVFLSDICSSIDNTVSEVMDVMHNKACRIEDYISQLPTLNVFDSLMVELCGFYCLQDSCSYGFPSLILWQYNLCLVDKQLRDKEPNVTSNEFIQVILI